jgi:hypothetical protein
MDLPHSQPLTFAVATYGAGDLLKQNFEASPCFSGAHDHEFLIQRDYPSAASAYNHAIDEASNELIVFAHQDMIFPAEWLSDLARALHSLEALDPEWGVLGCYGVAADGTGHGFIYSPGPGVIGRPAALPVRIQTLDEIVLIIRKSSGLRFDSNLPHFHLYGTDLCLRAAQWGLSSYALSAYCIHNADQYCVLPPEFYECYRYIQKSWCDALPIHTSCLTITESSLTLYRRRLREAWVQIRRKGFIAPRTSDVDGLIAAATEASRQLRTQPADLSR